MVEDSHPSHPVPPLRIHHIAFAHPRTSAPQERFHELLGMPVCHQEDGPGFIERMLPVGDGFVQTLEATGAGVVGKFVGKRGSALHHIAFEVEDIEGYLRHFRKLGVRLIDEAPRPGGMGTLIAFVHPQEFGGLLVELVQVPSDGRLGGR